MKPFLTSSLAALAGGLMLAGCAVAPVEGPYSYGYGPTYYYDQGPVYYDQGPVYYDPWPGYYYGAPTITGRFRFGGGGRDRHWGGGAWHHESLTFPHGRTMRRGSGAARTPAMTRARTNRRVGTHHTAAARRDSDKS